MQRQQKLGWFDENIDNIDNLPPPPVRQVRAEIQVAEQSVYTGQRGPNFVELIRFLLQKGNLKDHYINMLTDSESMTLYDQAFTHKSANPDRNYEVLELLGDSTVNKAIVWYLSRRFPQLDCPAGVKVIARLKINLVSKKTLADFGLKLGLWPYISATEEFRETKMKPMLEDCFEAFFGATERLIDRRIRLGAGYAICSTIIDSLFDEMDISLKYEDLFDAKTRLKELFDYYGPAMGQLKYNTIKSAEKIQTVYVYLVIQYSHHQPVGYLLGQGSAALKANAEQIAAENALQTLNEHGYFKPVSEEYSRFCQFNSP